MGKSGWRLSEEREPGFVTAMLAAWELILDNFDLSGGVKAGYIKRLHKACTLNVRMLNPKSSPGDLRYLDSMIMFHAHAVTPAGLEQLFTWRRGDGAPMFYEPGYDRPAEDLDPEEVLQAIRRERRLTFRPWYPRVGDEEAEYLDRKGTMAFTGSFADFYRTKQAIQIAFAVRLDAILAEFNAAIARAEGAAAKLSAITCFIRQLEILHAFPDGNGRTYVSALMNHLLLYHGFYPAILYDKDVNIAISSDEWISAVEEGGENTRRLLEDPEARIHGYSILDSADLDLTDFRRLSEPLACKLAAWPGSP